MLHGELEKVPSLIRGEKLGHRRLAKGGSQISVDTLDLRRTEVEDGEGLGQAQRLPHGLENGRVDLLSLVHADRIELVG